MEYQNQFQDHSGVHYSIVEQLDGNPSIIEHVDAYGLHWTRQIATDLDPETIVWDLYADIPDSLCD